MDEAEGFGDLGIGLLGRFLRRRRRSGEELQCRSGGNGKKREVVHGRFLS